MKDKSICMIIPSLSSGGAERVVSILTSALAEQGREVYLIVHRHAKTEYPVSDKVQTLFLDECKCSKINAIARVQRLLAVRKFVKKNKIDCVVPFLDSCMKHTYIATRGLKTAFVSTLRNNPYERSQKESEECDRIAEKATANFVQNEEQKNYFGEKVRAKTFIVPNPVSKAFFSEEKKYSGSIKNLVAVGRLNVQKNYGRMLNAVRIVKEKYPDIRLSIYGEGTLEAEIQKNIDSLGLAENVKLMGRTGDVLHVLSQNDLFVMSSDYEGMPNALMEAMAFGMPCVSTDCPTGPATLIGDNERGMLAKPDDGDDLAEKIVFCIENAAALAEKGQKAREYMKQHFSEDAIAEEFYGKCTAF